MKKRSATVNVALRPTKRGKQAGEKNKQQSKEEKAAAKKKQAKMQQKIVEGLVKSIRASDTAVEFKNESDWLLELKTQGYTVVRGLISETQTETLKQQVSHLW